jgi:hypothetical protein
MILGVAWAQSAGSIDPKPTNDLKRFSTASNRSRPSEDEVRLSLK